MSWIWYKKTTNPIFLLHFSSITESCSHDNSRVVVPRDLRWVTNHTSIFCGVSQLSSQLTWDSWWNEYTQYFSLLCPYLPLQFFSCQTHACIVQSAVIADYRWLILRPLRSPTPTCLCFSIQSAVPWHKTSCKHLIQTIKQCICIFNSERNWVKGTSVLESWTKNRNRVKDKVFRGLPESVAGGGWTRETGRIKGGWTQETGRAK